MNQTKNKIVNERDAHITRYDCKTILNKSTTGLLAERYNTNDSNRKVKQMSIHIQTLLITHIIR